MKLEQTEDGTFLRVLTDDKGQVLFDIRCPVACGCCCDFWKDVPSIALASLTAEIMGPAYAECPHLKDNGCCLPRKKRPLECLTYLCELGILATEKLVTEEEITQVLDQGLQEDAFKFLGKFPPVVEGNIKDAKIKKRDKKLIKKILNSEKGGQKCVTAPSQSALRS